jgi:hypothetical protein
MKAIIAAVVCAAVVGPPMFLIGMGAISSGTRVDVAKATSEVASNDIPSNIVQVYQDAVAKYCPSMKWQELAAIGSVESDQGRNMGPSSAGAEGWMQFLLSTWKSPRVAVDGNGDGKKDILDPLDAIPSAANYLCMLGLDPKVQITEEHCPQAGADDHTVRLREALYGYNHACWYVDQVIEVATSYQGAGPGSLQGGIHVDKSGGVITDVPGFPGVRADSRIIPDILALVQQYHLNVESCYSSNPVHDQDGEHPLGLACDLVPADPTDAGWDLVDQLAARVEPVQNQPIPPFRWVGYNGDANHGRGNHLHLSWIHAPAAPYTVAQWVEVGVLDETSIESSPAAARISGFAGVFTTYNPLSALPYAGRATWVAVRPDVASQEDIQKLKNAGFKIYIWEAMASPVGIAAIQQYGASGYIAQAEGPDQLKAALAVASQVTVPKALVTNVIPAQWPSGWQAMPEAYQNSNPPATPQNVVGDARRAGASVIVPVFGLYDAVSEGGGRIPFSQYYSEFRESGAASFAIYPAEAVSSGDRTALTGVIP